MDDGGGPGLDAAVVAVDARGGRGGGRVPEGPGLLLPDEEFDILARRALIALEGKDIVCSSVDDLAGDVALAAHRVDGDDGALDGQHVQRPWGRRRSRWPCRPP